MQIEDKVVPLSPGMAVTVEIKTGSRRLIEYLLSPVAISARKFARKMTHHPYRQHLNQIPYNENHLVTQSALYNARKMRLVLDQSAKQLIGIANTP
jgi:hypothetical protein